MTKWWRNQYNQMNWYFYTVVLGKYSCGAGMVEEVSSCCKPVSCLARVMREAIPLGRHDRTAKIAEEPSLTCFPSGVIFHPFGSVTAPGRILHVRATVNPAGGQRQAEQQSKTSRNQKSNGTVPISPPDPYHISFRPNWTCRGVLAAAVTCPNELDVTEVFGAANCT